SSRGDHGERDYIGGANTGVDRTGILNRGTTLFRNHPWPLGRHDGILRFYGSVGDRQTRSRTHIRLKRGASVATGGTMRFISILVLWFAMGLVMTADGVPTAVTYIPHDKVSATMAKGGSILNDHGLILLAQRRGMGEVELHEKTNHVFIIVEGEATFVVGGTMVNPRVTAPDQKRAPSAEGGQTYHLTKGDVITIPAKTPHWFKDVSTQTIAYYAVNIEQ